MRNCCQLNFLAFLFFWFVFLLGCFAKRCCWVFQILLILLPTSSWWHPRRFSRLVCRAFSRGASGSGVLVLAQRRVIMTILFPHVSRFVEELDEEDVWPSRYRNLSRWTCVVGNSKRSHVDGHCFGTIVVGEKNLAVSCNDYPSSETCNFYSLPY